MCRAGGRRCKGGTGKATQATRKQRSRATKALREARASGDPDAIRTATERLDAANEAHKAAKENAMSHHDHDHDTAGHSGDVTTPKPGPVTGATSDKPLLDNTWGDLGNNSPVHYHDDGPVGTAVKYMGKDAQMDVDGEPLANVVGKLATDVVRRKTTAQQAVNDLKDLRDRLPEGSRAKMCLSQAIRNMDGPDTPVPQVPEGTPEPLRDLVGKLHAVPMVRKEPEREMQPLLDICGRLAAGDRRTAGLLPDEVKRLRNNRHESLGDAGKFEIDDAVNDTVKALNEQERQQREQRAAAASSNTAGQSGDVTYTFHGAANINTGDGTQVTEPHQQRRDQPGKARPWGQYETTDDQGRHNRFQFHGTADINTGSDTSAHRHAQAETQHATAEAADITARARDLMRRHNIPDATGGGTQIDMVNGRITRINGHRIDDPGTSTNGNVHNHVSGEVHGHQTDVINGGLNFVEGRGFTIGGNSNDNARRPAHDRDVTAQVKQAMERATAAKEQAAHAKERAQQARSTDAGTKPTVHTGPRDPHTGGRSVNVTDGDTTMQVGQHLGDLWVNGERRD